MIVRRDSRYRVIYRFGSRAFRTYCYFIWELSEWMWKWSEIRELFFNRLYLVLDQNRRIKLCRMIV